MLAAGDTRLRVIATGPAELYKVASMHGAVVRVELSNHAVVTATRIGGSLECFQDGSGQTGIAAVE